MTPIPITCHILDVTTGNPASDVLCSIYRLPSLIFDDKYDEVVEKQDAQILARARTNGDGRIQQWIFNPDPSQRHILASNGIQETDHGPGLEWKSLQPGYYKIRFQTGLYFKSRGLQNFHPFVDIVFQIENGSNHYHIPLLLSNYGYTTYKGS